MKIFAYGSLALALTLASCNGSTGGTTPNPTPAPTATPCVLPSGTSATSSTFPAADASGVNYIVPAVNNTIDVMSAGTLTGSGANLTIAIANGTCLTQVPPGSTIYQFIAMTAVLSPVTFPTLPGWAFTFPSTVSTAGKTFALYQYTPVPGSTTGWTQILGNGVVSGQTVTFAAGGTGFTLQASALQGQIFALTSTP